MNTFDSILGEEGTQIIEELKIQMVLTGEENIKLFNNKKKYL